MKITFIILSAIISIACNNSKSNDAVQQNESSTKSDTLHLQEDLFKKNVVIILSEALDEKSSEINIQDYIQNGKSFIPVFTSLEKFNESTQGKVQNKKVEIKGIFLLSLLKGNETLKINPGLIDEQNLQAGDLIKQYSHDIELMKEEMKKMK